MCISYNHPLTHSNPILPASSASLRGGHHLTGGFGCHVTGFQESIASPLSGRKTPSPPGPSISPCVCLQLLRCFVESIPHFFGRQPASCTCPPSGPVSFCTVPHRSLRGLQSFRPSLVLERNHPAQEAQTPLCS